MSVSCDSLNATAPASTRYDDEESGSELRNEGGENGAGTAALTAAEADKSESTSPRLPPPSFSSLPDELVGEIFSHFNRSNLEKCLLVSRAFYTCAARLLRQSPVLFLLSPKESERHERPWYLHRGSVPLWEALTRKRDISMRLRHLDVVAYGFNRPRVGAAIHPDYLIDDPIDFNDVSDGDADALVTVTSIELEDFVDGGLCEELRCFCARLPNLSHVSLTSDYTPPPLSLFPNLTHLSIRPDHVPFLDPAVWPPASSMPPLMSLRIAGERRQTSRRRMDNPGKLHMALDQVFSSSLTTLRTLELDTTYDTEPDLTAFSALTHLTRTLDGEPHFKLPAGLVSLTLIEAGPSSVAAMFGDVLPRNPPPPLSSDSDFSPLPPALERLVIRTINIHLILLVCLVEDPALSPGLRELWIGDALKLAKADPAIDWWPDEDVELLRSTCRERGVELNERYEA
ncbi:hypothetical protein JCM10207_001035 [Rhodosporidiobolus poonsookiae]